MAGRFEATEGEDHLQAEGLSLRPEERRSLIAGAVENSAVVGNFLRSTNFGRH